MKLGGIQVDSVIDGVKRPLRPGVRVVRGPLGMDPPDDQAYEAMWAEYREYLSDDGRLEIAVGCFLIRTGDRVILIDAGGGAAKSNDPAEPASGLLLQNLAKLGVRPEDITDVVFTHLHHDHVGWASQDGEAVFPHAAYRCDTKDWSHFVDPLRAGTGKHDPRVTDKIVPIEDRLEPFTGSGSLAPGVDALAAPGHTPGSTIIVVSSGEERVMLLGDVVHCPVELLDEDWQGLVDVDPVLAKQDAVALARELEGTDVHISAAHFPNLEFGRLLTRNRQTDVDGRSALAGQLTKAHKTVRRIEFGVSGTDLTLVSVREISSARPLWRRAPSSSARPLAPCRRSAGAARRG